MSDVLDAYLLELFKKDRPLAKTLQFILFQLNRIDQQIAAIPPLNAPEGPENASLYLPQGHTEQQLPVSDRTMFSHRSINVNEFAFQLGAMFYNRLEAASDSSINGILHATNGQRAILVNVGSTTITITHENAFAASSDRILTDSGFNFELGTNEQALIWRDDVTDRWRACKLSATFPRIVRLDIDLTAAVGTALYGGQVIGVSVTGQITSLRPVIIWQAPGPYVGKGTFVDESEMDGIIATANPRGVMGGGTVLDIYWNAFPGPVYGSVGFYVMQGMD